MKKPFVILFAGPVGSSKSTIAHHLSWNLNLPIFSNDSVRKETVLEGGLAEGDAYLKKRNQYLNEILKKSSNFILDASIDRSWVEVREKIVDNGYDYFIISIDISKEFLKNILGGYHNTNNLGRNHQEHQNFLKEYRNIINVSIDDKNFSDRLKISLEKVRNYIK